MQNNLTKRRVVVSLITNSVEFKTTYLINLLNLSCAVCVNTLTPKKLPKI